MKDLINKFSILKRGKYFSSRIFQNYLVLMPSKKCIKYFSGTTRIDFTINNLKKKTQLKGIVEFVDADDILDIHKYLMKGT